MSKMVTLNNGRKVKVKRVHTLYGEKIHQIGAGFVFDGELHASLWDAEEAVATMIRSENSHVSLRYSKGTLPRFDSLQIALQYFQSEHHRALAKKSLREHRGKAVACRLDNLGRIVDFFSVEEWYKKAFQLPLGWHYFRY